MASVRTVAIAAMAANTLAMNLRVVQLVDQQFEHDAASDAWLIRRPQKSKLIIFFITKTPIIIHTAQHAIIRRPVGWVHSSSM